MIAEPRYLTSSNFGESGRLSEVGIIAHFNVGHAPGPRLPSPSTKFWTVLGIEVGNFAIAVALLGNLRTDSVISLPIPRLFGGQQT